MLKIKIKSKFLLLSFLLLPIIGHAQSCPSATDIKNAETSASSTTLSPDLKAAKGLMVSAMKQCPKKLLCSQISSMTPHGSSPRTVMELYLNEISFNKKPYFQIDSDSYQTVCSTFR